MFYPPSPISTALVDPSRRAIAFTALPRHYADEREEVLAAIDRVLQSGHAVGGPEPEALEAEISEALGGRVETVTLASGTDALRLALIGLGIGPGDEVITQANSFIASTAAICQVGATPVFADVRADQMIDPADILRHITPRTRALMPVHLTGQMADMDALRAIAERHHLAIIEDAAQAFGSHSHGRWAGTLGDIGCFSAHPLKNFNAAGDAGFLVTRHADIAARIRRLRNHGLADRDTALEFGYVSRLDAIQAAILRLRLPKLPHIIAQRRANADYYRQHLDPERVMLPVHRRSVHHSYHLFVIQVPERQRLRAALAAAGIATKIHYPIPIHRQPAAAHLGWAEGSLPVTEAQAHCILSLPIHQYLTLDDIEYVATLVNRTLIPAIEA